MVTTPDDDHDEVQQTFTPFAPAIPSRAAGEVPLPPKPMFEEPPASPKRTRKAKKPQRLPPREIKRITKNRRNNVKKTEATRSQLVRKVVAPVKAPSRNRPLEMKQRLNSVLGAVAAMSRAEAKAFTGVMSHLEDMSRSSRKRVIEALAQVYV